MIDSFPISGAKIQQKNQLECSKVHCKELLKEKDDLTVITTFFIGSS